MNEPFQGTISHRQANTMPAVGRDPLKNGSNPIDAGMAQVRAVRRRELITAQQAGGFYREMAVEINRMFT